MKKVPMEDRVFKMIVVDIYKRIIHVGRKHCVSFDGYVKIIDPRKPKRFLRERGEPGEYTKYGFETTTEYKPGKRFDDEMVHLDWPFPDWLLKEQGPANLVGG
jgi:hypothetical protein